MRNNNILIMDLNKFLFIFNWIIIFVFSLSLLWPIWKLRSFFVIDKPVIVPSVVELSKNYPSMDTYSKLNEIKWGFLPSSNTSLLIQSSNNIIKDLYTLNNQPTVKIRPPKIWEADPFDDPSWCLQIQAWLPIKYLLAAYDLSSDNQYLIKAHDLIFSWIEWEEKKNFWEFSEPNIEYTWNDHAMSERAIVLSSFWSVYRNSNLINPTNTKRFLETVIEHGEYIKNKDHYTYISNHGIMQDLALMHLAIAFPHLITDKPINLAVDRFDTQIKYLVSQEGVYLEHSPGYQHYALKLMYSMFSYLKIIDNDVPSQWQDIYVRMSHVFEQLIQPDFTLPGIGDTMEDKIVGDNCYLSQLLNYNLAETNNNQCIKSHIKIFDRKEFSIWPSAGYAIFWDETPKNERQLITTWSNFPRHAHKHADELSIYLFAFGRPWITGPGYWPYGSKERNYAIGWDSSNAPHLDNEPVFSQRTTKLISYGKHTDVNFLDLVRIGPNNYMANRQILWYRPDNIFIFDRISGAKDNKILIPWHFAHGLQAKINRYTQSAILYDERGDTTLELNVVGSEGLSIDLFQGRKNPFGGWLSTTEGIIPTPTIETSFRGEKFWLFSWISFYPGKTSGNKIQVFNNEHSENWKAVVNCENGNITITKSLNFIEVIEENCPTSSKISFQLTPNRIQYSINDVDEIHKEQLLRNNDDNQDIKSLSIYQQSNYILSLFLLGILQEISSYTFRIILKRNIFLNRTFISVSLLIVIYLITCQP